MVLFPLNINATGARSNKMLISAQFRDPGATAEKTVDSVNGAIVYSII
jgi:hypothetical protein